MKRADALTLAFLLLLAGAALFLPWLSLPAPDTMELGDRLIPPQWTQHPILGTDSKGRDLFVRTLAGARISLWVGLLGSFVALLIGLPYGAISGLFGGRTDRFMMRLADFFESVPITILVLFLLSILGEYREELQGLGLSRLHIFFFAVGFLFWLPTARIARAEALRLRQALFVDAARSLGASRKEILVRHFFPNLLPASVVIMTLTIPRVILMEAFLSFLGLGVEPPGVSWGILAKEGLAAMNPLVQSWWLLAVPATALALTLICLNHWGDKISDSFRANT
ncbi:MAG: ABC transporter permease [Planctomycetota bacterium]|nr:ABC transporter permease [Planctomycetota bacterium]